MPTLTTIYDPRMQPADSIVVQLQIVRCMAPIVAAAASGSNVKVVPGWPPFSTIDELVMSRIPAANAGPHVSAY